MAILLLGNHGLRRKCRAVTDFHDPQVKQDIACLKQELLSFRDAYGFGRAIAAPQIGINRRIVALYLYNQLFAVINPVITRFSTSRFSLWDDCMSFPHLMVKLSRYESVSVEYMDELGAGHTWEYLPRAESELLQHELDHLDGILAVDYADTVGSLVYRSEFEKDREYFGSQVDYVS